MENHNLSVQEVKQMDMVEYLEKLGYSPQKIRNNDYWYLSPLREEKEPSFKVNRKINAWYDHSLGQGGNLADFGILYHKCNVKELLKKMQDLFSFRPQKPVSILSDDTPDFHIIITGTKPLSHPALFRYLHDRRISFEIAKRCTEEVHFQLSGKPYYAVGFKNNSGGFELRNQYFKGSSSPKDVTLIKQKGATELSVIEGFFSFLSYKTVFINKHPLTNFLVLNSLSFFKKNMALMEQYPKVKLYLDNDSAGNEYTRFAIAASQKFTDERHLYKGCNDLNEWLTSSTHTQTPRLKMRR